MRMPAPLGCLPLHLICISHSFTMIPYRSRPYQLWLATGGFGCSPIASGRRIFATSLYDGERSSFYRQDFSGIIKPEVWEEVQSQYDFQITTQEVYKDSETPQEGMEP